MKRLFNAVFVALLSAAFIFLSGFLLQNQESFYQVSKMLCAAWKQTDSESVQRLCTLIRYLITLTPLIWVYYFSVLVPRRLGWRTACLITSIATLLIGSFLTLLSIPNIYYAIFSKICYWEIDVQRSRIPLLVLHLLLLAIALFLIYEGIYRPSIKKNEQRWLSSSVFLKNFARYVSILGIGHFALFFAVALQGFLFESRLVNLTDFLGAAEKDSRHLFGVLLLLFAEPLVHELAFRGLIFEHMKSGLAPIFAGLISSLLYVVWYWNTGLAVYAFLFGLLLCYVAHQGGRLRYAIFLHMLVNVLRMSFFAKGDALFFRPIAWLFATEKHWLVYAHNNSAMMLVCSAGSIAILAFLFKLLPAE